MCVRYIFFKIHYLYFQRTQSGGLPTHIVWTLPTHTDEGPGGGGAPTPDTAICIQALFGCRANLTLSLLLLRCRRSPSLDYTPQELCLPSYCNTAVRGFEVALLFASKSFTAVCIQALFGCRANLTLPLLLLRGCRSPSLDYTPQELCLSSYCNAAVRGFEVAPLFASKSYTAVCIQELFGCC